MFGYLSIAQLSADIRAGIDRIPRAVDLVVGIPRSGMIPAYLIGLLINRQVVDLETFLANGPAGHGSTRKLAGTELISPAAAQHVLLVDDSVSTGASLQRCLDRIRASGFAARITTCIAVVVPGKTADVDVYFREMQHPRVFEWNAFHHPEVVNSCFDLDGVLCVDPTDDDNDDGPAYERFLESARALITPTQRIGHIVSARLEKYREATEAWLKANGVAYGALHLVDLPTHAERQRLGVHASHKAKVYRSTDSFLFYESDAGQAAQIAQLSNKPVLCTENMQLYLPGGVQNVMTLRSVKWHLRRPVGRVKGWVKRKIRGSGLK